MNYIDIACPVCDEKFTDSDDVVVCPVCGTPHHRSCWKENGGCKNAQKHNDGFIWQHPQAMPHPNEIKTNVSDFKTCPRCGEKNAVFEPVCTRCGERLKANRQTINDIMPSFQPNINEQNTDYTTEPNPDNFSPYQNMYAADARAVFGDDAKIEDISVSEIAEYVQKDSNKYIGKFLAMKEKKSKFSWNWSAGIFSVFWYFYRKMMGVGFAVLALLMSAMMLASFVPLTVYEKYQPEVYKQYVADATALNEQLQNIREGGIPDKLPPDYYDSMFKFLFSPIQISSYIMFFALALIINISFGFFSNHLYKKKILKDIRAIRQVAVNSMAYHMYIRQRGGVSVANVVMPIVIYMFFNIMRTYF